MHIGQIVFCLEKDDSVVKSRIRRINRDSIWVESHPYRIAKLNMKDELGKQWFVFPNITKDG